MPELPEVETARKLIADEALNRLIADADDPRCGAETRYGTVGGRSTWRTASRC